MGERVPDKTSFELKLFAPMAHRYLCDMLPEGVDEKQLENYLAGGNPKAFSLKDIFIRLIASAQNYQRMPNVIKFWERSEEVGELLNGFDPEYAKDLDPEKLYRQFRKKFGVTSADTKQNSWRKWSKSVVDAGTFVSEFEDGEDFDHFVGLFSYNTPTRMALPLLISKKISGIGFALACDFLKELGYVDYPKPDVHMIDICASLGLCGREQPEVFETIVCAADAGGVTPYRLDKTLWLICSGTFYLDGIKVPGRKWEFIEWVKESSPTFE